VDLRWPQGRKRGRQEELKRGTFWRGTAIEPETRLRVARAIDKDEEKVSLELMKQIKDRGHKDAPPPMATDGDDAYRKAMIKTWGKVPPYKGAGRRPTKKRPGADWRYVQVVKHRSGGRVVRIVVEVVYGDETTLDLVGAHTSYVERTNLTSRQMNGRLVRKTLSFSKELEMLKASSVWEDVVYNLTRPVKTLCVEGNGPEVNEISRLNQSKIDQAERNQSESEEVENKKQSRRYQQRSPAMAAGLTDHIWSIKELLMTVVAPTSSTQDG
jgi:hypothetical protein